jgi:NAD(P)-dependent dehydrogenase (short-subunit alcohol dehydrogenase family)
MAVASNQGMKTGNHLLAMDFPSQTGKVAVVTGGSDGIGFEVARALAKAGAYVLVATHNDAKGIEAVHRIRRSIPAAEIEYDRLELTSLASIEEFSQRTARRFPAIDLLVNNAGIAGVGRRLVTHEGFEAIFASNYLGHFALTARLLPLLLRDSGHSRPPSRVVHLSSVAHRIGRIDFQNLQGERHYHPSRAYTQSKLAMLLFALELDRRARAAGLPLISIAAHPGAAKTHIFDNGSGWTDRTSWIDRGVETFVKLFGQSAEAGAAPVLCAAMSPAVQSGGFYGPGGSFELRGRPAAARLSARARDPEAASRLWEVSERLAGVSFLRKPRLGLVQGMVIKAPESLRRVKD